MVAVGIDDLPTLFLPMLSADPGLALDRGVALIVRGIAGVDCRLSHDLGSSVGAGRPGSLSFVALRSRIFAACLLTGEQSFGEIAGARADSTSMVSQQPRRNGNADYA